VWSDTGWPDRDTIQPYGAYTDFIAPYFGITGLVAVLIHRNRTGGGQHLDLSQYEAAVDAGCLFSSEPFVQALSDFC
jgi:benzylsuccinate CoA-transferase BbsF subunit